MAERASNKAKSKASTDLRIPMTAEQMKLIESAVASSDEKQISVWARELILQAAKALAAGQKSKRKGSSVKTNPPDKSSPSGEF